MKRSIQLILILFLTCIFTETGLSQPSKEYKDEINETRFLLEQRRIIVIKRTMHLTSSEAEKFWPLYEKYNADIKKIGDREVKLITLYADNFQKLTDKIANYMVQEHFAIIKAKNELQASYFPKFKAVLPVIKAARFFQIENKIDALNENDMARKIPLLEEPK